MHAALLVQKSVAALRSYQCKTHSLAPQVPTPENNERFTQDRGSGKTAKVHFFSLAVEEPPKSKAKYQYELGR